MAIYLEKFCLPSEYDEHEHIRLNYELANSDNYYPFKSFFRHQTDYRHKICFEFEPLTCFYGGNGSGKTTLLNIIAEKLALKRKTTFNQSPYFNDYLKLCLSRTNNDFGNGLDNGEIITSDDIFDYILDIRHLNQGIEKDRKNLISEYRQHKDSPIRSLSDYHNIDFEKRNTIKKHKSQHSFVQAHRQKNIKEQSNGESAYAYFTNKIQENSLYLLDEPENSLSPERQLELMQFLMDSVRFYHCQFIIATHSPFLLSIPMARIYDLDNTPIQVRHWTQLNNIKIYHRFFKEKESEFF